MNNEVWEYYKKNPFWSYDLENEGRYPECQPKNWVTTLENARVDFANFINSLLTEVDNGEKSYEDILWLTRRYEYFSTQHKGIILPELRKTDSALDDLFMGCFFEIVDIGDWACNTSREILDLAIKSILNEAEFCKFYESASECNWRFMVPSKYKKDKAISDYLSRCLICANKYGGFNSVFKSLCFQKDIGINMNDYLFPSKFVSSFDFNSIQYSAINYIKYLDLKYYEDSLNELAGSSLLLDDNIPILKVTLCKLKYGQEGLINLYNETLDKDIKCEIINCYKHYKTKEFAEILLKALEDGTQLENGHYPVRVFADIQLSNELFSTLMEWFGIEILDHIRDVKHSII